MSQPIIFNLYGLPNPEDLTAIYNFSSKDVGTTNATWKNKNSSHGPSKNIIYNSSGLLPMEGTFTGGGSILQHNVDGPNYLISAAKVTVPNTVGGETSSSFYKPFFNRMLPVGNYTFRFKIKSAVSGVTQKLRYGFSTTTATTNFDIGDTWQTISVNGTVTNASANTFFVIGSQIGMGVQLFYIDELQLYPASETIPNYIDDGNDGHAMKPYGIRNPITKNGEFITNTPLALQSPQFPVPKEWTAMTALFALRINSATTQSILSTIDDGILGTSLLDVSLSIVDGEPSFSRSLAYGTGKLTNQGFIILGISYDSTQALTYVNEVITSFNTGYVSKKIQTLSLLTRLPSTSNFVGDLAMCTIWDKKLTPEEWYHAVKNARKKLFTYTGDIKKRNWYLAEGDSITAAYSAPQGKSYAYRMSDEIFDNNESLGHLNLATSGHSLNFVEADLPYMLDRIAEVRKGGGKAIVSLLIGRNDNVLLQSNAACDAYFVRLKNYYTAVRNAGAKVIAVTCLPSGSASDNGGPGSNWEIYRNYLNNLIRTNPSFYDALADFGNPSVSIMGDVATADNLTYYASDGVHPYPAGHAILGTIIKPVIQSLLNS